MGRATFYMDLARWQVLRQACLRRRVSVSAVLRALIDQQLATWAQEEQHGG